MSVRERTSVTIKVGPSMFAAAVCVAGAMFTAPAAADQTYDRCIEASNGSNEAWSTCGGEYLNRVDGKIDAAWKRVFPNLTEEGQKLLYEEQRNWTTFKDSACLYLGNGDYGRGGQVLHRTTCQGKIIEQRIEYLNELVNFVTIGGE